MGDLSALQLPMRRTLKAGIIDRARDLRRHATECEKRLWWKLREFKRAEYHWRRQAPFRAYILDFVEHAAQIVVELDGSQHGLADNRRRDAARDALLQHEGYKVLRFSNVEVIENLDSVVEAIVRASPPPPTRSAARSDLPTRGR